VILIYFYKQQKKPTLFVWAGGKMCEKFLGIFSKPIPNRFQKLNAFNFISELVQFVKGYAFTKANFIQF